MKNLLTTTAIVAALSSVAFADESLHASSNVAANSNGGGSAFSSTTVGVTTSGANINHTSGVHDGTNGVEYGRTSSINANASGIQIGTSSYNGADSNATSIVLNDSGATVNGDATVTGDLLISNGLEGDFEAKINVLEELQGAASTANAAYVKADSNEGDTKHTQPVSYTHLTLPTNREV